MDVVSPHQEAKTGRMALAIGLLKKVIMSVSITEIFEQEVDLS